MASACIQSCVDDARVPIRATYVNLYKWPESDAEFVKTTAGRVRGRGSATGGGGGDGGGGHGHHHHHQNHPRVVDSISCRQMYLRSYTFSRKETVQEKTRKCIGRVRERVAHRRNRKSKKKIGKNGGGGGVCLRKPCVVIRKVKKVSCAALFSIFRRLLACTTRVDVVDQRDCCS